MTTLIDGGNGPGVHRRCDARCHEAKRPKCECICGSMNHGVGGAWALVKTRELGQELVQQTGATVALPLPGIEVVAR